MSDLYFTADEHYGHERIIQFCNRPFASVRDHIDQSIARHNAKVPKGARVYHVGDIFWRTMPLKTALDIINALNGEHYFIWGNHDELLEGNEILRGAFHWCKDIAQVHHPTLGKQLVLCHYAMHVWRNSHRGAWHLYGHTHNNLPEQHNLSFDCGQDAWNFAPVSIEEVAEKMKRKIALGHEDPMCPGMRARPWDK